MKYLIRAVKYFIKFSILCALIIAALVLIGAVEGDINSIFSEGYGSIGKIAIFFAIVSAVYPLVGFIRRDIAAEKDWNDIRADILKYMEERHYDLESETDGRISFRIRGLAGRLSKMYEDRITIVRTENGYLLEGLRKDVLRLSAGIENIINS